MTIVKGCSFGDIYGTKFARDDSGALTVTDGKPVVADEIGLIGNPNPDFMVGFMNTFSYKGITLKFLIDGRFGGKVLSVTEAMLDEYGVSQRTADARDAGKVEVEGVSFDPQNYYSTVGGRAGIAEAYMYDATNIRLRELSIGFALPFLNKMSFVNNARLSLVGRNLFFFSNEAPFDPDVTFSTGVGFQGVDVFSLPTTRSFGFNLSLGF